MSFLGVDIGSSQVKAAAFSCDGVLLHTAYRKYAYTTPEPGFMELDSNAVLSAAFEAIAETSGEVKSADPVQALAISSQGEAFTPVDADGVPLCPAMISGDSRAERNIERFTSDFGKARMYRITGHTPSPMFTLGKLLWLAENRPEIRRKAVKFLCFEDLLVARLGIEPAMGWPLAARTMLFDVHTHEWSSNLLDAIGFSASEFARALPSGTVAGEIPSSIADRLNLGAGVTVVTGGHDQMIAALGCGAWEPGVTMYAAGSVECFVPVVSELLLSDELCANNLCSYDFSLPGRCASVAYSLTGSNLLQYFLEEFAPDLKGDYGKLLDSMPDRPTDILTIPYFTPSGTPFFDSHTPGTLCGWRLGTSRGTLLKGLEEGIGLEMKLNMELLKKNGFRMDSLIATGGGFRHPAMLQLRSDILGLPIKAVRSVEAGCRGASLLAQSATCSIPVEKLPGSVPPVLTEVMPDHSRSEIYREKFLKHISFLETVRNFHHS